MKQFQLTWFQRYYRLLAKYKLEKLTKYDRRGNYIGEGLEYHHVRPVSIYGTDDNLVIAVPGKVHARLHWLLWNHYRDNGVNEEAAKMKYAWETLDKKWGTSEMDERWSVDYFKVKDCYRSLWQNYGI